MTTLTHSDQQSLDQVLEDLTMDMENMNYGERPPTPIPDEDEVLLTIQQRLSKYRYANAIDDNTENEEYHTDDEDEESVYGDCGYHCDGHCQTCDPGHKGWGFDMTDES